jgi:hypothetical protein
VKEYLDLAANFISKVGFPVFVALILLWRNDIRHTENLEAMRDLVHTVKDQHLAIHCKRLAVHPRRHKRAPRRSDKH